MGVHTEDNDMIKKIVDKSFREESGVIYFYPYGILGNKIKVTNQQRIEISNYLYKDYLLTLLVFILSFVFSPFLLLVFLLISIFLYHKKISKIETVKINFNGFAKKLELQIDSTTLFFDVICFICAVVTFATCLFLFIMNPNAWPIVLMGIFFSVPAMAFFIYLFILRYKKKKKDGR
ncbi:MAG: hypothetical protein CO021_03980 [Deltaproteobacteria bacterium CG_4_9_14_0_2_um_filter_42_21]|nr:MAG: hypothetical protein CO021_03980 [Deltaproteobacteria bacterium CG_4_9_14_0_2_um_filter_42_21]